MSQNYLNIIGNWGTSAQQGRQRAQAEAMVYKIQGAIEILLEMKKEEKDDKKK